MYTGPWSLISIPFTQVCMLGPDHSSPFHSHRYVCWALITHLHSIHTGMYARPWSLNSIPFIQVCMLGPDHGIPFHSYRYVCWALIMEFHSFHTCWALITQFCSVHGHWSSSSLKKLHLLFFSLLLVAYMKLSDILSFSTALSADCMLLHV